jgi:carboxyl-terminal processing protease
MQNPPPYPQYQPLPQAPKRSNGCLIGGIVAALLGLCACGAVAAVVVLGAPSFLASMIGTDTGGAAIAPTRDFLEEDTPAPRRTSPPIVSTLQAPTPRPGLTPGLPTAVTRTPTGATPVATARPVATAKPSDSPFPTTAPGAQDKASQQRTFDQAWTIINENYVDPKFGGMDLRAERDKMTQRINAGMSNTQFWDAMADMIDRLSDNHSYFLSPPEAEEDEARYVGEDSYIGVGVSTNFNPDKKWLYVLRVTPGGPAERAGIRPHDILLRIDGKPSVNDAGDPQVGLLRGTEGTNVRLTVRTPGKAEREVTVARAVIRSNVLVDYQLLPGSRKIGYMRIPAFDEKTIRDKITDAIEEMMNQSNGKMDGLIVDVRQNGGGTYPQLASALGLFTKAPPGEFVNRKGEKDPLEVIDIEVGNSFSVKLVILIGRDTESFGEIFAGALQYGRGATLIGQPSAGNIELLRAFRLNDGSKMSIAIQTFRLPNGTNWEGKGLTPNIPVAGAWDEFGADDPDPVLKAAIEALAR